MKKQLLLLTMALLSPGVMMAVPAKPGKIKVMQADGTTITIEMRGDEYSHTVFTEDGYPLIANKQGLYEYASLTDGKLIGSGIKASEIANRSAYANNFLKQVDLSKLNIYNKVEEQKTENLRALHKAKAAENTEANAEAKTRLRISNVPTTGSPKALVILVEFRDKKFSDYVGDAKAFYTDLLNKPNYTNEYGASGSAYDFYTASSNGKYTPQFDVYGPVTVSQQESFYAGTSGQANVSLMVYEAVKKLDSQIDFSQYDTDGDGEVDNIYFFYAGMGQADTGTSGLIWPHNAWVSLAGYDIIKDGVKIDRYACSSELNGKKGTPLGIGTFVHEFGHVLGIPDLYDTDSQFTSAYTVGKWDTMCNGSYNDDQNTPPLYSAYERYALGWIEPTLLDASIADTYSMNPLADENKAYIIPAGNNDTEYFLLENRQLKGWDAFLPGHGLLVWHIDENKDAWQKNAINNSMNNPAGHKCVDIVDADGISTIETMSGDAFPGTANVTSSSFKSWAGKNTFSLTSIAEQGDIISFAVEGQSNGICLPTSLEQQSSPLYTIDGRKLSTNTSSLQKGIYIKGGKKIMKK